MTSAESTVPPIREWVVDTRTLWPLVGKEVRDSLRNKWFILYTVAFVILSVGVAYLSQVGTGFAGLAGFGKTAASLVNLTLLVVPLMGVTMGALSLSAERDRGMLAYVLAQPVTRTEVFIAKFFGQSFAFVATIAIGFGVSAALLARHASADGALFLTLAGLSMLLALSMLAIGMLIGTLVRRPGAAMGVSIFVWLCLTLLGDLGMMGASTLLSLQVDQMLFMSFANPTQVFKLASIASFDSTLDLLGPAGLYAVQTFGDWLFPLLIGLLVAWVFVPAILAWALFVRRPL
ncbi:MAG: ABC transporter permease subunit [Planctomycetales bacterium]|nr:ABC transporter permease subunit [Planctomycetales bacterium]